jgi:hypothetical protein
MNQLMAIIFYFPNSFLGLIMPCILRIDGINWATLPNCFSFLLEKIVILWQFDFLYHDN